MKTSFQLFTSSLLLLACISLVADAACRGGARLRRDWRDTSTQAKRKFINAIKKLRTKPSLYGERSRYDDFTRIHRDNIQAIHGQALFLPWHRAFLRTFEDELRKIDGSVTVPTWDWTYDAQDPTDDGTFFSNSEFSFGTRGSGSSGCLYNGFPGNWRDDDTACLRRVYDTGISFDGYDVLASLVLNDPDFGDFRDQLENSHNDVHRLIGGDRSSQGGPVGDMLYINRSPNDPLFFLHHAHVDYLFYAWQKNQQSTVDDYDGNNVDRDMPGLPSFTVRNVWQSYNGRTWCVRYAPYSGAVRNGDLGQRDDRNKHHLVMYQKHPVGSGKTRHTRARKPKKSVSRVWISMMANMSSTSVEAAEADFIRKQAKTDAIRTKFDIAMDAIFVENPNITYAEAYGEVVSNWNVKVEK